MKNIQEQIGHLQHIIQLLPLINRDTLYVLLQFLGLVAENAEDKLDETGKEAEKGGRHFCAFFLQQICFN